MIVKDLTANIQVKDASMGAVRDQLKEILKALKGNLNQDNIAQMVNLGKLSLHSLYFNLPNIPMQSNRIIGGKVNGTTGALLEGTGFTSSRSGVGSYPITYSVGFTDEPTVVAISANNGRAIPSATAASGAGCTIGFVDYKPDVPVDTNFYFLVWGPV